MNGWEIEIKEKDYLKEKEMKRKYDLGNLKIG